MAFTYSTDSKRYHNTSTGRFVGRVEVRNELDSIVDLSADRMKQWTLSLKNGYMSIPDWQETMADEIKSIHMSFATTANGGWDNMTDDDWGRVEGYVAEQYDYLRGFAEDIYTGEQLPNGTMAVRASLYAEAARQTYENERRLLEQSSGATQEKNILGGSDHCRGCVDATLQGWVEIDTLVPIGLRECSAKCRCTIIYRLNPNDKLGSEED